jgi:mono/diheme cytochrome c family protein
MPYRWMAFGILAALPALAAKEPAPVTFHKDVLPVLQKHCQNCHRPGEVGPMPLLSYKETRPWATAIREAVLSKKMPPWFADPHYGKFTNERTLSKSEIEILVAWASSGAPEGSPKDAPVPVTFAEGWGMGKPDMVFEMPNAFDVQASGTIEYQYIVIPTGFTEDKWVTQAEARPGNRAVTHHIIASVREPGANYLREAVPGVPFVPKPRRKENEGPPRNGPEDSGSATDLLVGYAPGMAPMELKPGQAKLVKAGSDIVLQLHYTTNGKPASDRSRVGLMFAKTPPRERVFTANTMNTKFVIPPGDPNVKVEAHVTLQEDATLVDLMPHMHLRGKDFQYRLVYPTGESETILNVPRFDFNWQLFYYLDTPKLLPKGTRIECTAHFDNSANHPGNPDPNSEVRWGDQSWEEMMIGWFDLAVAADRNPKEVLRKKKTASD